MDGERGFVFESARLASRDFPKVVRDYPENAVLGAVQLSGDPVRPLVSFVHDDASIYDKEDPSGCGHGDLGSDAIRLRGQCEYRNVETRGLTGSRG